MFFFKINTKYEVERLVSDLFLFFKEALYEVKACDLQLRFNCIGFFRKGSRNSLFTTFCAWFFKKNVPHFLFYWLSKSHCVIAFISSDFGQYVYYNCLWCDVINLEINHIFLMNPFFYLTKKCRKKLQYLDNKKSFQVVIKSIFHRFLKAHSVAKNCRKS